MKITRYLVTSVAAVLLGLGAVNAYAMTPAQQEAIQNATTSAEVEAVLSALKDPEGNLSAEDVDALATLAASNPTIAGLVGAAMATAGVSGTSAQAVVSSTATKTGDRGQNSIAAAVSSSFNSNRSQGTPATNLGGGTGGSTGGGFGGGGGAIYTGPINSGGGGGGSNVSPGAN